MIDLLPGRTQRKNGDAMRQRAMVDYLRAMVLQSGQQGERFHALFLDRSRMYLGDAPFGQGQGSSLTLRMRDVFGKALALDAHGIVIAHNHPSGYCRPSEADIDTTARLNSMAKTLDIDLLDHLIFTHSDVYSMRAGGLI